MKFNVEVECTPEEARRLAGLPDLTPLHERYVAMMGEAMAGGVRPEAMETILRNWAPMGEASTAMWRQMFHQATKPGI